MKLFTKEELEQMRQMKNQGATYKEIGEMFGRSEATVQNKFSRLGWSTQPQAAQMTPPPVRVREKTLDDFTPREIIKHLYNLGYRIENNQIVIVEKRVVNIKSVLEE